MSATTAVPAPGTRARISIFASRHRSLSVIIGVIIVGAILPVWAFSPFATPFQAGNAWMDGYTNAGVFVLLALGLNIVVGVAGLLDLGYAAFFAIGAYTYAYSASPFTGLAFPFWPMLIAGALVAAVFGILLGAPTLRLRGDYLAIVTLGFGEIVPIAFNNSDQFTNGTNGIGAVLPPALPFIGRFSITDPWPFYLSMLVVVAIVMIFAYRLIDSRIGRAWEAIREDELAAASNGVNTVTSKLLAFALGASTAGIAGVFNAAKLTAVTPDQFYFTVSFTVLAMVVLGGMGNIWGVAVGAFTLYTIQSVVLKSLNTFFQAGGVMHDGVPILKDIDFIKYQFLLYGLALVGMMLWRPEGLFPNSRRKRELRAMVEAPGADELASPEETEEGGR